MCGPVWYTVTISTEGGILITTDITTMTNYTVTGLNDNTVYHVNVTASNNAGSSHSTGMWIMTNDDGKLIIHVRLKLHICMYSYVCMYVVDTKKLTQQCITIMCNYAEGIQST